MMRKCVGQAGRIRLDAAQPAIYDSAYIGFGRDGFLFDFNFGGYTYWRRDYWDFGRAERGWVNCNGYYEYGYIEWDCDISYPGFPAGRWTEQKATWLVGRFENMDSLIGLYVDQNDDSDVACAMAKIIDTEAVCSWDMRIYPDCNASAS